MKEIRVAIKACVECPWKRLRDHGKGYICGHSKGEAKELGGNLSNIPNGCPLDDAEI